MRVAKGRPYFCSTGLPHFRSRESVCKRIVVFGLPLGWVIVVLNKYKARSGATELKRVINYMLHFPVPKKLGLRILKGRIRLGSFRLVCDH